MSGHGFSPDSSKEEEGAFFKLSAEDQKRLTLFIELFQRSATLAGIDLDFSTEHMTVLADFIAEWIIESADAPSPDDAMSHIDPRATL